MEVVAYNPAWPGLFEEEKARIAQVLEERALDIHHIGSTSVQGLAAKPIIDIMPVVRDIVAVDECNHGMEEIGYTAMGEYGIPGRRFFARTDGDAAHRVNVHVFQRGDSNIERHLAFRDYLRAFPAAAAEYAGIKIGLAKKFTWDIESYMDGKDGFIKENERRAIEWHRHMGNEQ